MGLTFVQSAAVNFLALVRAGQATLGFSSKHHFHIFIQQRFRAHSWSIPNHRKALIRCASPYTKFRMTSKQIDNCQKLNEWNLGNKVLYDLCSTNFTHDTTEKILAKTLLIGRAYAAAIERRKNKSGINDNFYLDTVAPTFKKSKLDKVLADLKRYKQISSDTLPKIIDAHNYLTQLLFDITELEKRSFSSKYLHFHLPELFFIYDTRAVSAMRLFVKKLPKELQVLADRDNTDKEYTNFFYKCFFLRQTINEQFKVSLTPRQLDNLLIETANKEKVKQNKLTA